MKDLKIGDEVWFTFDKIPHKYYDPIIINIDFTRPNGEFYHVAYSNNRQTSLWYMERHLVLRKPKDYKHRMMELL